MSIDISLLRKKPEDRIRIIVPFGDDPGVTLTVRYCGKDESKQIRDIAAGKLKAGTPQEDAFNAAYGQVALVGWTGLNDGEAPLDYTPENVELLMLGSAEIRAAVITAATSLKAGLEKN